MQKTVTQGEIEKFDRYVNKFVREMPQDPLKQHTIKNMFRLKQTHSFDDFEDFMKELKEYKEKKKLPGKSEFRLEDIVSPVWNREMTIAQLDLVNMMLEKIRGPPPLLLMGQSAESDRSFGIERLQTQWWKDPELRKGVLSFKESLENALFAFNEQALVNLFGKCIVDLRLWIPVLEFESFNFNLLKFQEAIAELDNIYYMEGNSRLSAVSGFYECLLQHEVGKLFLLSIEETKKAVEARLNGGSEI